MLSRDKSAFIFLLLATFFWSGNFIVGKAASIYEIPPFTLNFYRWLFAWIILAPFTLKEILSKTNSDKNTLLFSATMPKEVLKLAKNVLNNPVRVDVTPQKIILEKIKIIKLGEKNPISVPKIKIPIPDI